MKIAILNDLAFTVFCTNLNTYSFEQEINNIAQCIKSFDLDSISVQRNWISTSINNTTIGAILLNRSNTIDSVARSLVLTKMTKNPFSDSIVEDYFEHENTIVEGLYEGEPSIALAAAFISGYPLFSFPVNPFMVDSLQVEVRTQSSDDNFSTDFKQIANFHRSSNTDFVLEFFENFELLDIKTAEDILRYVESHDKIVVLPDARRQIADLDGNQYRESILRHLIEICKWSRVSYLTNFDDLNLQSSNESANTANNSKLMEFRTFNDGEGNSITFNFHTKPAGGYRIYLSLERRGCVMMGYVGPHLPL